MTDKVTVVIDNNGDHSDHAIYFVACNSRDEANTLARLVLAFDRGKIVAIGTLNWWEGQLFIANATTEYHWWTDDVFGADWQIKFCLDDIIDGDTDDDMGLYDIIPRLNVSDLRCFQNIEGLRLLADAIESGEISQCR